MTNKTKCSIQAIFLGTLLIACDSATVISADGKSEEHYCRSGLLTDNLVICVLKDCPEGYDQIVPAKNHIDNDPLFRCRSKKETQLIIIPDAGGTHLPVAREL